MEGYCLTCYVQLLHFLHIPYTVDPYCINIPITKSIIRIPHNQARLPNPRLTNSQNFNNRMIFSVALHFPVLLQKHHSCHFHTSADIRKMRTCGICYNTISIGAVKRLKCECEFCKNCIIASVENQLENVFIENFTLMCPSLATGHKLDDEDLRSICPITSGDRSDLYDKITAKVVKAKLNKFPDTRACPSKDCEFVGWVNGKCLDPLECPDCGAKWKDPTVYPILYRIVYNIYGDGLQDAASGIWKEFWTERCPKCEVSIMKNGGCPHMTCMNCNHEFCWMCSHDYYGHGESICIQKCFMKYVLFFLMFILLLAKFAYHSDCGYIILELFY